MTCFISGRFKTVLLLLVFLASSTRVNSQESHKTAHVISTFRSFPQIVFYSDKQKSHICGIVSDRATSIDAKWYEECSSDTSQNETPVIRIYDTTIFCNKSMIKDFAEIEGIDVPKGFAGYLGLDFLQKQDIAFDPINHKLSLGQLEGTCPKDMDSLQIGYEKASDEASAEKTPAIPVLLGKATTASLKIILSLSNEMVLQKDLFDKLLADGDLVIEQPFLSSDNDSPMREGRIAKVRIGKTTLDNVFCREGKSNILGANILHRFQYGLSLRDNKLLLKLQKDIAWDHSNTDGINAELNSDNSVISARVVGVAKSSIAEDAGIVAGDRIIEIDGVSLQKTHLAMEKLIMRERSVKIKILRNDTEKEMTLNAMPNNRTAAK